jgi:dTDP-4-amino-4,6-dideoxygalactose transaminase
MPHTQQRTRPVDAFFRHMRPRVEPQTVPFAALGRQHARLDADLHEALDRVVHTDGFVLGEEVELFEAEYAAYCGAGHCVGVNSGTAALTLALVAAGIGAGDEVLVPGHTFIASALAVVHAGATPVFCDVDPGTGLIDPRSAEAAVGPRTAAIVAVHLYGQVCDMPAVRALARRHGLFVLEDAAQAHGATFAGRRAGGWGDAAAFSFYPSKNLGALGDGGAICTDDAELAARARALRHLGQRRKGEHRLVGYNERLDGLQAAFLRVKLPLLDEWNAARREHAAELRDVLEDVFTLLDERPESPCIYHLFPVRTPERDAWAAHLAEHGVAVVIHYTPAAHAHPAFADLPAASRPVQLPAADAWAAQELSLPIFAEMTPDEVAAVAEAAHA